MQRVIERISFIYLHAKTDTSSHDHTSMVRKPLVYPYAIPNPFTCKDKGTDDSSQVSPSRSIHIDGEVKHHFAICFPGDQLPVSLRRCHEESPDPFLLSSAEEEELRKLFGSAVPLYSGDTKGPSECGTSAQSCIHHTLDLQHPSTILDVISVAFPLNQQGKCQTHSLHSDNNNTFDDGCLSNHKETATDIWHYLVVYPSVITPEGMSVYQQFFEAAEDTNDPTPLSPDDKNDGIEIKDNTETVLHKTLKSTGEPVGGVYRNNNYIALHKMEDIIFDHMHRIYRLGDYSMTYTSRASSVSSSQSPQHRAGSNDGLPPEIPSRQEIVPLIGDIHLIGFSKGGVVLNQIATELAVNEPSALAPTEAPQHNVLMRRANELGMHYVDCGLNSKGAFLSEKPQIESLITRFTSSFPSTSEGLAHNALSTHTSVDGASLPPMRCDIFHPFRINHLRISVYSTLRQRDDLYRPFLDHERRIMCMNCCDTANKIKKKREKGHGDNNNNNVPLIKPATKMYTTVVTQGLDNSNVSYRSWATTSTMGTLCRRDISPDCKDMDILDKSAGHFTIHVLEDIPSGNSDQPCRPGVVEGLKMHMMSLPAFAIRSHWFDRIE